MSTPALSAHALLVCVDAGQWCEGYQGKRRVPSTEMREVSDVVDEHRAAWAAGRRPSFHAGGEHEVVKDELAASVEQIEETNLAIGALEDVILVNLNGP